jgi:P27 family predicted phage terminase small subunit
MAGRPPKPTSLKLVTGNPGKRAINKQEPDPTYLQDLTPPEWLGAGARQVWEEMAPAAARNKLLTEVDVEAFAMGCTAIAQYRHATTKVGEASVKTKVVINDEGRPVEAGEHLNPWAMVQSMTFKQAMAVFDRFGMSPQARTRIAVQPQGDLFGDNSNSNPKGTAKKDYFTK